MEKSVATVFLADDHGVLREGLKYIIEAGGKCQVVGEASNGREALQMIDELIPRIVVMDISMPEMTGIEATRQLRRYHPDMKIIILSRHDNEEYIEQLLKYGIHGYVLKDDAGTDIARAIDAVLAGQTYLSPRITSRIMRDFGQEKKKAPEEGAEKPHLFSTLTNREIEILKLVAEGKSSEQIATDLRISPRTVKVHRSNLMKKLDVHKSTDLVKYAVKSGLIEP